MIEIGVFRNAWHSGVAINEGVVDRDEEDPKDVRREPRA